MKRLAMIAPLAMASVVAFPSTTRGPAFSAPATAADSSTTDFEVNGLHIILRKNSATDVVAANLYLLGGVQQLTPQTHGIEALLLAASGRGSHRFPGPTLRQEVARLGSEITVGAGEDFSTYGLKSIRSTFDSTWVLYADRLLNPTLTAADVDLVKSQMITGLRQVDINPDELLNRLADSVTFVGHPYGLATEGTEQSLAAMSPAHLREYMQRTFVTSRMLLVVVGNVDRPKIEQLVRTTIATFPKGNYIWTPPTPLVGKKASVVRQVALPTN